MRDYLEGAIYEMMERLKLLKTEIPKTNLFPEFSDLVQKAHEGIEINLSYFRGLLEDVLSNSTDHLTSILRGYRAAVNEYDSIENYCVAILNRLNKNDLKLTRIIHSDFLGNYRMKFNFIFLACHVHNYSLVLRT